MPVGSVVTTSGGLPGTLTVTLLPGVAVPEITGLVVVGEPFGGWLMATVGGAFSTVKLLTAAGDLPAALLVQAVTEFGPTGRFRPVNEYVPDGAATVVRVWPWLVVSVTVVPGVAVPLTKLVPMGCNVPVGGERIATVGCCVTVKLVTAGADLPPALLVQTVAEFGPAGKFSPLSE